MNTSAGPIFRQLARTLGEAIETGEIAVGDLLPTETTLAQRHSVSRQTVRQALSELRARGLIESKQGIGSVVVRRYAGTAYTETYSSVEELTRFAKGTPIHTREVDDIVADAKLAASLRGRAGQSYVRITGLRYDSKSGQPVGYVIVHVDGTYSGVKAHAWNLKCSIAETIERLYGVTIARIEQEVSVALLDVEIARLLKVKPGTPALTIKRWYAAENGRIFESSYSSYAMGRFVYRNVLVRQTDR